MTRTKFHAPQSWWIMPQEPRFRN